MVHEDEELLDDSFLGLADTTAGMSEVKKTAGMRRILILQKSGYSESRISGRRCGRILDVRIVKFFSSIFKYFYGLKKFVTDPNPDQHFFVSLVSG